MASDRPAARSRIKPAGWVVIVLFIGGVGYATVHFLHLDRLIVSTLRESDQRTTPDAGTSDAGSTRGDAATPVDAETAVDGGATESSGTIVNPGHFLALPPDLPKPSTAVPIVAYPPMLALSAPPNAIAAGSEAEALRAMMEDRAAVGVVSVAALAAHPEAIAGGARAIWLFAVSRRDGALEPSCEAAPLRAGRLGVVRGSLAHFHLLAVLAGEPLPFIAGKDDESALDHAYSDGSVSAGAALAAHRAEAGAAGCGILPDEAFSFVVVARAGKPFSAADLSAVRDLAKDPPSMTRVASFFQPATTGLNTFDGVFRSASATWAEVHVVATPMSPRGALDRRFIDPTSPARRPSSPPSAPRESDPGISC